MAVCPRPQRYAQLCNAEMEELDMEGDALSLDALIARFTCSTCLLDPTQRLNWQCVAVSETMDCHPGFMPFSTARDMMVLHCQSILYSSEYISEYVMFNGTKLRKFVRSDFGILSDVAMNGPGTQLIFVTGNSKHSDVTIVLDGRRTLNPNFAAIRSTFRSMVLLLNPLQAINLQMGRLGFDLGPKVLSAWCSPFLNSWADFIIQNPGVCIEELYMSAQGLNYGSPSLMARTHLLTSENGMPIILQYFRDALAKHFSKILALARLGSEDGLPLPKGEYLVLFCYKFRVF